MMNNTKTSRAGTPEINGAANIVKNPQTHKSFDDIIHGDFADTANGDSADIYLGLVEANLIRNITDEQEPPALFNINGVEVLPKQAVAIIAAQKKSGKSNFAGLLMAAGIKEDQQLLNGALRCNSRLKFLNIDTEQPKKDARRTLRRTMRTAGYQYSDEWSDKGVYSVSIKDIDRDQMIPVIEAAVKKFKPDVVFIDGIADLMESINDEQESAFVLKWMGKLSETNDCAVVGMLHLNHGTDKIGGWAGTMANKKFTDSFLLKKKGYFTVTHEGRGESAPDLTFRIECPQGDKIGWYAAVPDGIPEMTREDNEETELRELMADAPLPCDNQTLVRWVINRLKKCSESKANRKLSACKKYGILSSQKEGKRSIWFKVSPDDARQAELPLISD